MLEHFKNKLPVSDNNWDDFTSRFERLEIPAKTILLKENDISRKLYLIEKGCVRAWLNRDGKDITFQFFFENDSVASIESFRKKIPSSVTLETIEPSVIWWVHRADIDWMVEKAKDSPLLMDSLMNMIFDRTFEYMKHFVAFIRDTPQQRYLSLIQNRPEIVKRVPQHYIASYLGITTVHLSRIKNHLAKNKC